MPRRWDAQALGPEPWVPALSRDGAHVLVLPGVPTLADRDGMGCFTLGLEDSHGSRNSAGV